MTDPQPVESRTLIFLDLSKVVVPWRLASQAFCSRRRHPSNFLHRPMNPQPALIVQQVIDMCNEMSSPALHPPVAIQLLQQHTKKAKIAIASFVGVRSSGSKSSATRNTQMKASAISYCAAHAWAWPNDFFNSEMASM